MSSTNDVIAFTPRPPPELKDCELRLVDDGFGIEVRVIDEAGHIDVLGTLPVPERLRQQLREVWPRWQASSSIAC